jgi:hypothetical protein
MHTTYQWGARQKLHQEGHETRDIKSFLKNANEHASHINNKTTIKIMHTRTQPL